MKTRPLCMMCLLFLMIQSLVLILKSGNSLVEVPASSVFCENEGQTVYIQGQVYQKSNTSNIQILYLKNNSVHDSKLLIYDKDFTDIPIGKIISLKGTIGHFERARNPGNFDQALYYARQELYGVIWCDEVLDVSGETQFLKEKLYDFKIKWKEQLVDAIGEKNGTVLAAMLLGEKGEMDAEVKELYQKNGIGHLLAISGLHISFIGLGLYYFIRKTGLPYWVSGICAVAVLTVYVFMIGFSVSVIRAYVMLLLRIGADMTGRVYDAPTALGLAAALTVFRQPLYLTDAGFYMSYVAILGIYYVLPALQTFFVCKWKWLAGGYASLAVNMALFPILLWYYFEFPTYSLILNMLVIPLMSAVLGLGMIGSFFVMWIKPVGVLCLKGCHFILLFFESASSAISKLPMARLVLGKPNLWSVILYYVVMILGLVWIYQCKERVKFRKSRKYLGLLFLVVLFLVTYRYHDGLQITMLDVGQGDGIFIRGPEGTTFFIDGGSSDVNELGKYRIEPYLKSQGVGKLDYVFVTHGDTDHYSGIKEMLERHSVGIPIQYLVLPTNFRKDKALSELAALAKNVGTRVVFIKAGQSLQDGELQITCIQPTEEGTLTGNEGSLVLEMEYGQFSMLCTGDVEGKGEQLLSQLVNGKQYDVLKVAHHGSRNSTTEEFLNSIRLNHALISAGEYNSYGHPHAETIERLEKEGCKIYQTKKNGAITLLVNGNSLTISLLPYRL